MIIRDVILVTGYFVLFMVTGERIAVRPSMIGKATTFFQLGSVTIVLVGLVWPGAAPSRVRMTLFVVAATATTASGLHYMVRGLSWLQQRGVEQ